MTEAPNPGGALIEPLLTRPRKVAMVCLGSSSGEFLQEMIQRGTTMGERPFDEIWTGAAYDRFRNAILKDRASVPICNNCSEGLGGLFYDIEKVR